MALAVFLPLPLVAPALAQGPPPSGSWRLTKIHRNGTITTSSISSSGTGPWYQYIFAGGQEREVGQGMGQGHNINRPGPINDTITSEGSVDVEYTYVDASGRQIAPPAPGKLYILENLSAAWGAGGDFFSGSASDGVHPEIVTSTILSASGSSSGVRLRQFDVSSGKVSFNSGRLFATANAGFYQSFGNSTGPNGGLSAGVGYATTLDSRGVIISCDAMENGGNWRKANGVRVRNVRSQDLSMQVDSVVSLFLFDDLPQALWFGSGSFRANLDGFDPTVDFWGNLVNTSVTWKNAGYSPDIFQPDRLNLYSRWAGSDAQTLPATTVSVEVTDLRPFRNATAKNAYTVRWHDPYENPQRDGPVATGFKRYYLGSGYVQANYGEIIAVTPGQDWRYWLSQTTGLASSWTDPVLLIPKIKASPQATVILTILGAAASTANLLVGNSNPVNLSIHDMWDNTQFSTYSPERSDSFFMAGRYKVKPFFMRPYARVNYLVDVYQVNGYQGIATQPWTELTSDGGNYAGDFDRFR